MYVHSKLKKTALDVYDAAARGPEGKGGSSARRELHAACCMPVQTVARRAWKNNDETWQEKKTLWKVLLL